MNSAVYYSFCLNKCTDICSICQLSIFVRAVQNDFTANEELLDLVAMHNTTKVVDIYKAFHLATAKMKFNVDFKKCSAIVTDRALAMVGTDIGFCGHLKKHGINCTKIHSLIH